MYTYRFMRWRYRRPRRWAERSGSRRCCRISVNFLNVPGFNANDKSCRLASLAAVLDLHLPVIFIIV